MNNGIQLNKEAEDVYLGVCVCAYLYDGICSCCYELSRARLFTHSFQLCSQLIFKHHINKYIQNCDV